MAITDGLSVLCADLQASGGLQQVLIREWNSTGSPDQIVFNASHSIASITDSGGTSATWGVFESKIETSSLTISGATVKNVSTYDCNLSFNIPKISLLHLNSLDEFRGKCLMVLVKDTNDQWINIGISNVLTGGDGGLDIPVDSHIGTRPQTFAKLASIEGGTGAAFSDENGLTVTINCTQYELPRISSVIPSIAADGLSATTA